MNGTPSANTRWTETTSIHALTSAAMVRSKARARFSRRTALPTVTAYSVNAANVAEVNTNTHCSRHMIALCAGACQYGEADNIYV